MGLEKGTIYRLWALMSQGPSINWRNGIRFYLTNEDARVVAKALALLPESPNYPVFVGGSGMIVLEVMASLTRETPSCFVDISPMQVAFFEELQRALAQAENADGLRTWFEDSVYPRLNAHYLRRGLSYSLSEVMTSLRELFGIGFLFDDEVLVRAKNTSCLVVKHASDIVHYLRMSEGLHDFIYLSNVVDYMSPRQIEDLFASCVGHQATVYLLATSACKESGTLATIWSRFGYHVHEATPYLNRCNRGLGSTEVKRSWNRQGQVIFLFSDQLSAGKARRTD
jgi:hypothetical protein